MLSVDPERFDLGRFERLTRDARNASPAERARALREALDLWRGRALADFELETFAQEDARRLEELRLAAVEEWFDAELALDHDGAVVAAAEPLPRANPLRARLRGQPMRAPHRPG